MLQLNSQVGPQAVSGQADEGRPAGLVQRATPVAIGDGRPMVAGEPASFAEQQAQLQMLEQAKHGGEVPLAEQEVRREGADEMLPGSDAEQWLHSMLDQQAVRIEARDGVAGEARALMTGEHLEALATVGGTATGPQRSLPGPSLAQDAAVERDAVALPAARDALGEPVPEPQSVVAGPPMLVGWAPSSASVVPASPRPQVLVGSIEGKLPVGQTLVHQERLPGETIVLSAATDADAGALGQTTQPPLLERRLELQAPQAKWGEQMLHALRESVEVQLQQRVQHATIRLDPPELGSLEIFLSHESGRLNVQITAAQSDVARLLQHTSERLRQELVGQNLMQVSVQVSADGQSGQQHAQHGRTSPFDEEPVMAGAPQAEQPTGGPASRPDDVLITV